MYSGITSGRVLDGELLYTKILEVNLFAFAYRLFHRDIYVCIYMYVYTGVVYPGTCVCIYVYEFFFSCMNMLDISGVVV